MTMNPLAGRGRVDRLVVDGDGEIRRAMGSVSGGTPYFLEPHGLL